MGICSRIFGAGRVKVVPINQSGAFRNTSICALAQAKRQAEKTLRNQGHSRSEATRITSQMYQKHHG
jgi:hypothetical protein